jgi:hypothetical protein
MNEFQSINLFIKIKNKKEHNEMNNKKKTYLKQITS